MLRNSLCRVGFCLALALAAGLVLSRNLASAAALTPTQAAGVTDHTLALGAEEMPAYWQLLRDVESQSDPSTTTATSPAYDALLAAPDQHRGVSVQLTLNVRRILSYDIPAGHLQATRLYEAWGWADGDPRHTYVVVTPALPPGFEVGETVHERAEVSGYFLKLQGYLPAGAPQSGLAPLAAPLLLGSMSVAPPMQFALVQSGDMWRLGLGGLLVVSLGGTLYRLTRRTRTVRRPTTHAPAADEFFDWLEANRASE